jgi:tetratricopeptide (TPR) repeat protein
MKMMISDWVMTGVRAHRFAGNLFSGWVTLRWVVMMTLLVLLTGCYHTSKKDAKTLFIAEQILDAHPDSAYHLLKSIHNLVSLSRGDYARYALDYTKATDKLRLPASSDSLIRVAVSYYASANAPEKLAQSYLYLSRINRQDGNTKDAANNLMKAEEEANKDGKNYWLLGLIDLDKAQIYYDQDQLDSALNANKHAYDLFHYANDQRNMAVSLMNIGKCFSSQQKNDSALSYYQYAEKNALSLKDTVVLSSIQRLIGYQFYTMERYDQALTYLQKSIQTSSDPFNAGKYLNLGMVYTAMGNYEFANSCYQKTLINTSDLRMRSASYQQLLLLAMKEKRMDDVNRFADCYVKTLDSTYQDLLSTSLAGIEKRYNYERIAGINKNLIIRQQHIYIWLLFSFLIIALGTVFFFYYRNREKKVINRLMKQQLEYQQSKLDKLELLQRIAHLSFIPRTNLDQTGAQFLKLFAKEIEMASPANSEELFDYIDSAYNNLSQRVHARYPLLSRKDVLFCCMRYADFDAASIATILDIQINSVYRYNALIRDKMGYPKKMSFERILAEFDTI